LNRGAEPSSTIIFLRRGREEKSDGGVGQGQQYDHESRSSPLIWGLTSLGKESRYALSVGKANRPGDNGVDREQKSCRGVSTAEKGVDGLSRASVCRLREPGVRP